MKQISRTITLLAVLFLVTAPVFAESAFPPLVGHLIDGTERIAPARFENAVAPLVSLSAIPLGIAYNDSQGMTNVNYDAAILQHYGYGVPAMALPAYPGATPLDMNVIAIAIDYQGRNIMVYVGDNFAGEVGRSGVDAILNEVAKYAMDDPNAAFEAGFAKARDILDPPFNRGFRSFTATAVPLIPYILGGILLVVILVWLFRKMGQLGRANHEIGLVKKDWDDLTQAFTGGSRRLQTVVEMLQGDYVEEAAKWTNSAREPNEVMAGLEHELSRLSAVKLGLFSSNQTISETVAGYQAVFARFNAVEDWIASVVNEAKSLDGQVAGAHDLLFRIEPEVARVAGWYDQSRRSSRLLPDKNYVFGGLDAELDAAKQLVLYQSGGELRGARILENIRTTLEALEKAASLIVETEGHGLTVMGGARDTLARWVGELPDTEKLSSFPLTHLSAAIAQLTDDSRYDDVTEPANQAKAGFDALNQAATNLSASLTLRDNVVASLQKFFDQGYKNQVGYLLSAATETLSAAISAICAGEWTKATNSLSLSRTHSEVARKRMVTLIDLQATNERRLADLSVKVADADKYRTATVSPLWESLRTDFARTNWTEVGDNFSLATDLLVDLFDNPSDSSDLASEVASLNGMERQKFEESEKLLNEIFRQSQQAIGLLESIANRHALCVKARDTHAAALDGADTRLVEAFSYRDEHNANISIEVDENLVEAELMIRDGRKASQDKNFVLALAKADAAADLAIRTLDDAKGQESELTRLRDTLESVKAEAVNAVDRASTVIASEHDAIVEEGTERALREATSSFEQARTCEAGMAALEDRKLAAALQKASAAYGLAQNAANTAGESLANNKATYARLMGEAKSAISAAKGAISDAATACNDRRAGSAGDGELSSASALLPTEPSHGSTRSAIRNSTSNANSAKSKAEQAEREARASIRRYEEAEEAKRQAEAARKRAEERARQQALDSARRAASASSTSHRSTGGGISAGRSNTGGISGGRKF